MKLIHLLFVSVLLGILGQAQADEIHVAVASNFSGPIEKIARDFEAQTGHSVILAMGSTGRHYAQIKHGAPFEAFFAADAKRPMILEKEGLAVKGSRFTYAIGRLVLWSPENNVVDSKGAILKQDAFRHLALANPKLAPYGHAAREVLEHLRLWEALKPRMVFGENIGQAFQFVQSGNARLGFVALSQIHQPGRPSKGSCWIIPQALYSPIEQQAVLLKDNPAAREFLAFVKKPKALKTIEAYGYQIPGSELP